MFAPSSSGGFGGVDIGGDSKSGGDAKSGQSDGDIPGLNTTSIDEAVN